MIFWELFYTFFLIGLFTFGGGYAMIPLIQENVVGKGWLTSTEVSDFIAVSEMTPGPFAINISTFVGSKVAGIGGAALATIGVILPSIIIILIVAAILTKFMSNKYVKGALNGVKPVIISLILSTTILLFVKLIFFNNGALYNDFSFDIRSLALFLMLIGFMAIYKYLKKKSINPILLIGIGALMGLLVFI